MAIISMRRLTFIVFQLFQSGFYKITELKHPFRVTDDFLQTNLCLYCVTEVQLSTTLIKVLESLEHGGYYFCCCSGLFSMLPVKQHSACISKSCEHKMFIKCYSSHSSVIHVVCNRALTSVIFTFTTFIKAIENKYTKIPVAIELLTVETEALIKQRVNISRFVNPSCVIYCM